MSGPAPLPTEQIYDAMFDDDAFGRLPDLLARTVGARSAVLSWRDRDGGFDVLRHNGYFTDAHFADYGMHYVDSDPWIPVAYRPGRMNAAIRMDEEVDAASVRRTAFYNDWLRGMGDDTLHCLGAATSMRDGDGIIGLHRGAGASGAFTLTEAARLAEVLPHVTRVLVLRGRLAAADRRARSVESALDVVGMAMVVVDRNGKIVTANALGEAALRNGMLAGGRIALLEIRPNLAVAVALATARVRPSATAVLLPQPDESSGIVNVAPFAGAPGQRQAVLLFRHGNDITRRHDQLRALFGLTSAEADVALLLADGVLLTGIAAKRGTTVETVRSQLRELRHKMRCTRQVELVRLVNRVS